MKKFLSFFVVALVIFFAGSAWASVSLSVFTDPVFREYMRNYDSGYQIYDSDGNLIWVGYNDGILEDREIKK